MPWLGIAAGATFLIDVIIRDPLGRHYSVARAGAGLTIGMLIALQAVISGPEVLENAGPPLATLW